MSAFDPLMWIWCRVAYWLVLILPSHWRAVEPLWIKLLPFAGFYAYHTPELTWRWSERRR